MATVLLIGLSQLTAPAISFIKDMRPHCLGLQHNPPVPVFIGVVVVVGVVYILYPEGFGGDLLLQKQLPFRFRVELLCYMAVCAVVLSVMVQVLRRIIVRYQAYCISKMSAGVYIPTSADGPLIRRPVGRRSFDGRDAILRSTASTDVGDWLRRTASAVADLSALLPVARPSNRVTQDTEQLPV